MEENGLLGWSNDPYEIRSFQRGDRVVIHKSPECPCCRDLECDGMAGTVVDYDEEIDKIDPSEWKGEDPDPALEFYGHYYLVEFDKPVRVHNWVAELFARAFHNEPKAYDTDGRFAATELELLKKEDPRWATHGLRSSTTPWMG